jgi:predicted SnoaL-like aldol condensation-catalyzing enzyme
MTSSPTESARSAAITRAGSGLGRDIALGLADKGYVVFGTAMSEQEVQDLRDASGGRVNLTVCDITNKQAVKAWAVGDYVWAHVNFLNLFNDDPDDAGVAGVDIYWMDAGGKVVEHWDVLQLVGDPNNSAPWVAPNIPRTNPHGMF